jgi:Uma2 family endonuclease
MSFVSIAEAWPPAGQPFTTAELDRMPDDGRRYELIDGVLVVSPRPGTIHQVVAMRLAAALHAGCPDGMLVIPEPAVQLSRTTEFAPDITVAREEDVGAAKLTAPPLLAVEVHSPSTALIDLTRKKAAYAAFGVPSYWIVVPDTRRPELSVFELTGGHYERAGYAAGDEAFRAARPFPVELVPARLVAGLRPR